MSKPVITRIADLTTEIELKNKTDNLLGHTKATRERADFILKQLTALQEKFQKEKEEMWDDIRDYLRSRDMLPTYYDKKEHSLEIDTDLQLLVLRTEHKHSGINAILSGLLGD